jgi:hypothetical protein
LSRYFYEVGINSYSRNSSKWSTVANVLNLVCFYKSKKTSEYNKPCNNVQTKLNKLCTTISRTLCRRIQLNLYSNSSYWQNVSDWGEAITNHKTQDKSKTHIPVNKGVLPKAMEGEEISVWNYKQTHLTKKNLACQKTSFTRCRPFTWTPFASQIHIQISLPREVHMKQCLLPSYCKLCHKYLNSA